MLGECDVGPGHPGDKPVVDHRLGSGTDLLGGLKERDIGPGPRIAAIRQQLRRPQQRRHVHVVPARVHDAVNL